MRNKKTMTLFMFLVALTSCSNLQKKDENIAPFLKVKKHEDTVLPDYTQEYTKDNFEIKGNYIYEGEQLNSQYIDSETILYKTKIQKETIILKPKDKNYNDYKIDESLVGEAINSEHIFETDDYKITARRVRNPFNHQEIYIEKRIEFKNKLKTTIVLQSLDTGGETEIVVDNNLKLVDPKEVFNKKYPEIARYKNLKEGIDNKRLVLDISNIDYEDLKTNENDLTKYNDLDDIVGEHTVKVRVRVKNGFISERDNFIEKKVDFSDKLEDYKYEEILSDLSKTSLRFSEDGKSVLGGFNEYIENRLVNGNENLKLVTRILDEDKDTVGRHNVIREIIKDDKVVYSKKDKTFVSFNGPVVAVADASFFDLSKEVEKRTYRQTPYWTDPKVDPMSEINEQSDDFLKNQAKISRTHGATVIGAMIDELSYGKSLFWYGLQLYNIGNTMNNKELASKYTDKDMFNTTNGYLDILEKQFSDKNDILNKVNEVRKYQTELLKPAIEDNNSDKKKEYYEKLKEIGEKIVTITEVEKLKQVDLNFHTISIGSKGVTNSVNPPLTGKYLPSVLDLNKNIKLINMSYGNDRNYEDYLATLNMTDEQKQKAADEYNNNALYRFLIRSWLKAEKEEFRKLISEKYSHAFNAIDLSDYFENKDYITKEDFDKLLLYKRVTTEGSIKNAVEFSAANHDILMVRSAGNTYSHAPVDLTTFKENGSKRLIKDPNLKYDNNFGSVPNMINLLKSIESAKKGETYVYDYSYRKNILNVVGLASALSIGGRDGKEDFAEMKLVTYGIKKLKNKDLTPGMFDTYIEYVKLLNEARENPDKYPKEYIDEIEYEIQSMEAYASNNAGHGDVYSLTRAGKSMIWTMAAEGEYVYATEYDNFGNKIEGGIDSKIKLDYGSSFAAPRVTAVGALVQQKFPFMTAHQIKQTLLTTARDDFMVTLDNGKVVSKGIYGVDENIGWGILDKDKAIKGPARFVKALTHETNDENFVANVSSGIYEFSNDIEGSFNITDHMISRGFLTQTELNQIKLLPVDEQTKKFTEKTMEYLKTLNFDEQELFIDAGLTKTGNGTLVLSGRNKYKGDTVIKEGTLVERGSSASNHIIEENAKLKLDLAYRANEIDDNYEKKAVIEGDVINKGSLYSYSNQDTITKKYIPYEGSKTYVTPNSKLSVGYLDLTHIRNFDIDVFATKGIFKALENGPVNVFEGRTSVQELIGIKLGIFPISQNLSLKTSYEGGVYRAFIQKGGYSVKAEDKRALTYLNGNPNINTNGSTTLAEESLDALLFMQPDKKDEVNGESLANSLAIGYELSDLKLDNLSLSLSKNYEKNKIYIDANTYTKLDVSKENNKFKLTSHLSGVYAGIISKYDNLTYGFSVDYTRGGAYKNGIRKINLHSLGLNLMAKYDITDKYFIKAIFSETSILKDVTKDVLFENRLTHKQNQHSLVFSISSGINLKYKNLTITPFVGFDNYLSIFEKYDEKDTILGLKYDVQYNNYVKANIGLDLTYDINKNVSLEFGMNYKKWLSNSKVNLNVKSTVFDLEDNVYSVSISDNKLSTKFGININPNDNLSINFNYTNTNLLENKLNLGLKYKF